MTVDQNLILHLIIAALTLINTCMVRNIRQERKREAVQSIRNNQARLAHKHAKNVRKRAKRNSRSFGMDKSPSSKEHTL